MCNLYSVSAQRDVIAQFFRVAHNRAAAFTPKTAIFPGQVAPVIRNADDGERELVEMNWGFLLLRKGYAPKRVTNIRSDKASSPFWRTALEKRRCLVPATAYCEPHGSKTPAEWTWFALKGDEPRPPFSFAGAWMSYKGPVKKDGDTVIQDVFAFMTVEPNGLVESIDHDRMPVLLTSAEQQEAWLSGLMGEAMKLAQSYAAEGMRIVQAVADKKDLLAA